MKALLVISLFWLPCHAIAQGADRERAYTQQREAAARAADERAHIEAARTNNLPNSSSSRGSGSGGSNEAAIREMIEGWRNNRRLRNRQDSIENDRKYGAYTREVAKQAAAEKAKLEEMNRSIANMNAEIARRTAAYRQQMNEAGFIKGSDETYALMHDLSAVMPGGLSYRPDAFDAMLTYYNELMISKKAYNAEKGNAPWPVLMEHIYEYTSTWETALTDLDELAAKYPEAMKAIDTARMLSICYFFGLQGDKGRPTYNQYDADPARYTRMSLRFGDISARNPGLAISMLSFIGISQRFMLRNPISAALKAYTGKESQSEREIFLHLSQTALYMPEVPNNFRTYNWQRTRGKEMDRFWQSFSKEDWKVIYRVQRGSSVNLLESIWCDLVSWVPLAHTDGPLSTYTHGDYDNHQKGKWRTKPSELFKYLIEHNNLLVALEAGKEAGDADAINSLAVLTAHGDLGKDRSQVLPMLKEAAEKGSVWARWNLVMACGWDMKGYGAADHPAALQDLKRFCDGATLAQASELVIEMGTMKRNIQFNGYHWLVPDELVVHILSSAAAKGDFISTQRLKKPNPERYPY